jgi:hypothetical protein
VIGITASRRPQRHVKRRPRFPAVIRQGEADLLDEAFGVERG